MTITPLLQVRDLRVQFHTDGGVIRAVDGVSFDLKPGETLGIVGESGSGKSVTNLALLGLIAKPAGRLTGGTASFGGINLLAAKDRELRDIRGRRIAMIFQDPMTALNPFLSIAEQMTEVLQHHLKYSHSQALSRAIETLEQVGIPAAAKRIHEYPHQFSGGMRQRVMIAIALLCKPDILIADEPTTALDVTIQAQILELLKSLQKQHGTSIILITHDLGVVANICQRVLVMYAGRIVEQANVEELFADPRHPYTKGLLQSIPHFDSSGGRLRAIDGQPPDLAKLPTGCAFHPRCPYRLERCTREEPTLIATGPERRLACYVDLHTVEPAEVSP